MFWILLIISLIVSNAICYLFGISRWWSVLICVPVFYLLFVLRIFILYLNGKFAYVHFGVKGVFDRRISAKRYRYYDDLFMHIEAIREVEEDKGKAERDIAALEAGVPDETEWRMFKICKHGIMMDYEQRPLGLKGSRYEEYIYREGVMYFSVCNVGMYILSLIPSALFSGIHYLIHGRVTWADFFGGAFGIYLGWFVYRIFKATRI